MVICTPPMTEAQFQRRVIDTARLHGWKVCHVRPARTERGWRTPYEGDAGLPDLILAKDGRVILAELKSERGKVTAEQQAWITAAGGHLWRPSNWPLVLEILSRKAEA